MVIKPIEFAMIQQQNNVSKAQHNAETRPMTEQQGITQQVEKNVEQHSQQVNKKDNADNEKGHYDAKDKSNNDEKILYSIEDFDYGDLHGKHDILWNFYNLLNEPTLSVFAPISNSFEIKGYVVINIPDSVIIDRVYDTFNTNYLTLIITLFLSASFLGLYFIQVHKPIKEITKATTEYGKGNLS